MCDLNKPLFQCTLGEFAEAVASFLSQKGSPPKQDARHDMPKGIKGIMQIFGCSEYAARRIKNSGVIDSAIYQLGARVFVVDPELAKELYQSS